MNQLSRKHAPLHIITPRLRPMVNCTDADERGRNQFFKARINVARCSIWIIRAVIIELHQGNPCAAQVFYRLSLQQNCSIEKHVAVSFGGQAPKASPKPLGH